MIPCGSKQNFLATPQPSIQSNCNLSYQKCSVFVFVVQYGVINMKSISILGLQEREEGCYSISLIYLHYKICQLVRVIHTELCQNLHP